jgi:tRNA-Thr(GGU) m(6)t(6)A37 methyltransferase TsaA
MTKPIVLTPIGVVRGGRSQIFEDHWGAVVSRLVLDPAVLDQAATDGLSEFSHIEVVFHFHLETRVWRGAAHPRGNPAWPQVGVLAGHSPVRPNHLGVSTCALLEVVGLELTVQGLDAIDGTPILDIKPYVAEFQPAGPVREPAWMRELMAHYYLTPQDSDRSPRDD